MVDADDVIDHVNIYYRFISTVGLLCDKIKNILNMHLECFNKAMLFTNKNNNEAKNCNKSLTDVCVVVS